ncbi:hypothetical protein [Desulfovibrio sp. ZJ369]|uniref:hypothetical protein n=1 Tax=Desulfovibrio sp. ZJ369 TaxID=2709793 RepID=UPI0013EDE51F|nr:hypothetical protein [Desulfovibrio sp. ZJ369]
MSINSDTQDKNKILFDILTDKSYHPREEKILILQKAFLFPDIKKRTSELFRISIKPRLAVIKNIHTITDIDLANNIKCLKISISEYFAERSFSSVSIRKIYGRESAFDSNSQLYKENYDKLKVSDFLELIGYACEFAKQFYDMDTEKLEKGLLLLKSIDLALNNEPYDYPDLKSAHIVIDIFSLIAQKMESDTNIQKRISGGAKIVQLALKFLKGKI